MCSKTNCFSITKFIPLNWFSTNDWQSDCNTVLFECNECNFICYYRPPHQNNSAFFLNHLEQIFNHSDLSCPTFVIGDLSYNFFSHDSAELKTVFNQFGFENLIKCATRVTEKTSTSLDVIASFCDPNSILVTGDHDLVYAVVDFLLEKACCERHYSDSLIECWENGSTQTWIWKDSVWVDWAVRQSIRPMVHAKEAGSWLLEWNSTNAVVNVVVFVLTP
jgi:hypothetical protein